MLRIITVGLPRSKRSASLQRYLNTFSQPDEIVGWMYPRCKEVGGAEKSQLLVSMAPYLFVHVNQIAMDNSSSKNITNIEFSKELVNFDLSSTQQLFKAVAIIEHLAIGEIY